MANKDNTLFKELQRAGALQGIFSRVARQLNPPASPSHVRRVALGERNSKRILCALERELRRIEREADRVA